MVVIPTTISPNITNNLYLLTGQIPADFFIPINTIANTVPNANFCKKFAQFKKKQ